MASRPELMGRGWEEDGRMNTHDSALPMLAGTADAVAEATERISADAMPDVATSAQAYAERFAGPVGRYFLEVQGSLTLAALSHLPPGSAVLDVGGGHAQLTPYLVDAGFDVVTVGSDPSCSRRLAPWLKGGRCRFELGDLLDLAHPPESFDAVVAFRLLAHVPRWREFLAGLCRVARDCVVMDFPSLHSLNRFADRMFALKRGVEGDTRPFAVYEPVEIRRAFQVEGFRLDEAHPQFLLPMALYRSLGSAGFARALEETGRITGLTRWLGSPIIAKARREEPVATEGPAGD